MRGGISTEILFSLLTWHLKSRLASSQKSRLASSQKSRLKSPVALRLKSHVASRRTANLTRGLKQRIVTSLSYILCSGLLLCGALPLHAASSNGVMTAADFKTQVISSYNQRQNELAAATKREVAGLMQKNRSAAETLSATTNNGANTNKNNMLENEAPQATSSTYSIGTANSPSVSNGAANSSANFNTQNQNSNSSVPSGNTAPLQTSPAPGNSSNTYTGFGASQTPSGGTKPGSSAPPNSGAGWNINY